MISKIFEYFLNNKIILKSNKDFRIAYNEKVKQAEEIFGVSLIDYYYFH